MCFMRTKIHWEVIILLKADHQLLLNPNWSYLETPMGYLLTFGMIYGDDQRLNSNHNHALEMTFRSQNQYIDLVINWLETQNDHIWSISEDEIKLKF